MSRRNWCTVERFRRNVRRRRRRRRAWRWRWHFHCELRPRRRRTRGGGKRRNGWKRTSRRRTTRIRREKVSNKSRRAGGKSEAKRGSLVPRTVVWWRIVGQYRTLRFPPDEEEIRRCAPQCRRGAGKHDNTQHFFLSCQKWYTLAAEVIITTKKRFCCRADCRCRYHLPGHRRCADDVDFPRSSLPGELARAPLRAVRFGANPNAHSHVIKANYAPIFETHLPLSRNCEEHTALLIARYFPRCKKSGEWLPRRRLNFREIYSRVVTMLCAPSCYVMIARCALVELSARSASSTCEKSRTVRPVGRANNTDDDAPSRAHCPQRRIVVGGGFICLLVESGREKWEGEREKEIRGSRPSGYVASPSGGRPAAAAAAAVGIDGSSFRSGLISRGRWQSIDDLLAVDKLCSASLFFEMFLR